MRESELEDESADQAFEHSQRVERGEGVVTDGPFEALDDFINPDTLTPYEEYDEEDEDAASDDEGLIEQELCALATQSLEKRETDIVDHHVASSEFGDESSVESIELLARKVLLLTKNLTLWGRMSEVPMSHHLSRKYQFRDFLERTRWFS